MADDFDMVSDLNDGTAELIPAGTESAHGSDAVSLNQPPRTGQEPAKGLEEPAAPKEPAHKSARDIISEALKGDQDTPANAVINGEAQVRDPVTGKFVAKPAEVVDPNAPPADAAPGVAAPAGIDPTIFASLPAETQAQLARTMEGVATSQQRFARLEPIEQLINPRIEAWALNGMTPQSALNQLLTLSDFAGRDPAGFIKYMAQNNGVDLEELVLGMVDDEPTDPKIAALEKEISELKGFRSELTQQQQQAAHNAVVDNVLAFADEKGQDGTPLRPHLSGLGTSWLPYIEMVKTANPSWSHGQVLQQAYENACWNNPTVRGKMQEAAQAAATAEALRKSTEKAAAARTASTSLPSGTPTTAPVAPNDASLSRKDVIRAAMAQHSS